MPPQMQGPFVLALQEVNEAYGRLTAEQQDQVTIVADDELEAALFNGAGAAAQVEDWKQRQLAAIAEAAR